MSSEVAGVLRELSLWDPTDQYDLYGLICLRKHFLAVKNIAGLEARIEHHRKLDGVRSALEKRGAKVKELTPHDIDERDAVSKLCRLECHVRADFKLKVERPPSVEEAATLFEWLLTAIVQASELAEEEEEEEMFQEEEIRKVHRLADGGAYQLILTRGRIRSILTATGSEEDGNRGRRLAACLAVACDLGDYEAVCLNLAWIAELDVPDKAQPDETLAAAAAAAAAATDAAAADGRWWC